MDLLFVCPSWLLIALLLGLMFLADEVGFRLGARRRGEEEPSRTVSGALKGSIFGLVAFVLGFAFSMSASRHEVRQRVVLDEANSLGTCYLRAGLLSDGAKVQIRTVLRRYLDVRLRYFDEALTPGVLDQTESEMTSALNELWGSVEAAVRLEPQQVLVSQIIPAANAVIDLHSTRSWAVWNRLPGSVLLVLVIAVVVSSLLVGHSSGQAGRRHVWLWAAFNVLFGMVLFVVLDFDRPRRGLIQLNHTPLRELRATML